jgi:translation initiation factor 1
MPEDRSRIVYSTDKVIVRKDSPAGKPHQGAIPPLQQKITVRLERKGRRGKTVTLIEGLLISHGGRESLLKEFKTMLGTGGSLKNDVLEIQGDHCTAVIELLQAKGYRPKRSGG